jgi:hypothetical protein
MRRRITPAILVLLLGAPGCNAVIRSAAVQAVQGSGVVKEESREVGSFEGIRVQSALTAVVTVGPVSSVQVRGDDDLVPLVETGVSGGTLYARLKEHTSISPRLPLTVTITAPKLVQVEADGASTVRVSGTLAESLSALAAGASTVQLSGIDAAQAELTAKGASKIEASGKAGHALLTAGEASKIHADALEARTAEVRVTGASHADVRISESVRGSAGQASSLSVLGHPATKDVATSGASSVRYEN